MGPVVPVSVIPGGIIIPAPGSWTQVFELWHADANFLYYRLHLWFWDIRSIRGLGLGLVWLPGPNVGRIPGGFRASGPAALWLSFPSFAGGASPFLFFGRIIRPWLLRMLRHPTSAGLFQTASLKDVWGWRIDPCKRISPRVLSRGRGFFGLCLRLFRRLRPVGSHDLLEALAEGCPSGF